MSCQKIQYLIGKESAATTGVEYREKNDGRLWRLEWNTEILRMWNVEKYCFDGVECGERPVEH